MFDLDCILFIYKFIDDNNFGVKKEGCNKRKKILRYYIIYRIISCIWFGMKR